MQYAEQDTIGGILLQLEASLPPIFARKRINSLLGGVLAPGTLSNLQSKGYGPPCVRNGRNAIYERTSFLQWFQLYLEGGIKAVTAKYGELDQLK